MSVQNLKSCTFRDVSNKLKLDLQIVACIRILLFYFKAYQNTSIIFKEVFTTSSIIESFHLIIYNGQL